jgi:hypothetical protein
MHGIFTIGLKILGFQDCDVFRIHAVYLYMSLKSMDTAKYFQNGLAKLVEIWHTVIKMFRFYHLRFFSIF